MYTHVPTCSLSTGWREGNSRDTLNSEVLASARSLWGLRRSERETFSPVLFCVCLWVCGARDRPQALYACRRYPLITVQLQPQYLFGQYALWECPRFPASDYRLAPSALVLGFFLLGSLSCKLRQQVRAVVLQEDLAASQKLLVLGVKLNIHE